jgi:phosphoribosyl 1,2-cyclic phosphate phosphodiesterase
VVANTATTPPAEFREIKMKVQILGTAAAEGWPAVFCDCEACHNARKLGGKNIRTRSSLQIDDLLKIDLPPDTYHHVITYNLQLHILKYLLLTHSHHDHCFTDELLMLDPPFAFTDRPDKMRVFGNRECLMRVAQTKKCSPQDLPDEYTEIQAFQTLHLSPYEVVTVKALHGTDEQPLNYIIERDGRSFLYSCDTGLYEQPTWDFLSGRRVDMVISECTYGPERREFPGHMGMPTVCEFRRQAEDIGLSDSNTRWVLTHFSHGGKAMHEELVAQAAPLGFEIAYDGMMIEL